MNMSINKDRTVPQPEKMSVTKVNKTLAIQLDAFENGLNMVSLVDPDIVTGLIQSNTTKGKRQAQEPS